MKKSKPVIFNVMCYFLVCQMLIYVLYCGRYGFTNKKEKKDILIKSLPMSLSCYLSRFHTCPFCSDRSQSLIKYILNCFMHHPHRTADA